MKESEENLTSWRKLKLWLDNNIQLHRWLFTFIVCVTVLLGVVLWQVKQNEKALCKSIRVVYFIVNASHQRNLKQIPNEQVQLENETYNTVVEEMNKVCYVGELEPISH